MIGWSRYTGLEERACEEIEKDRVAEEVGTVVQYSILRESLLQPAGSSRCRVQS